MMQVAEPGHVLQPGPDRHPDLAVPDELGQEHAVVEPAGGQGGEGQDGDQEAGRHPASQDHGLPGPGQGEQHDDQHRHDRPRLDRPGEPERHPAPGQAPAAVGQPVAVEHREGCGQAEQRDPRLEEDRVGGRHAGRVHGEQPAGHDHRQQPAVTDQQAPSDHAGRTGQEGQYPCDRHARGGARRLGEQRDRDHQ